MSRTLVSPVRAVFFDLDDTLFDHSYSTRQSLEAIRRTHASLQKHSLDEIMAIYTRILDETHIHVLQGHLTIDQARLQRYQSIFSHYQVETDDLETALEETARLHRTTYQANRQVVEGIIPLLEYLHGKVRIAVVTNNVVTEQREKLEHLKLDHLIDVLVTSEETGSIKPDPAIFQVALERTNAQPDEAVMIGDSWKADIIGASRAGIRALWLNRLGLPCPDPSLAVEFHSFEPLAEILQLIQID